MRSTRSVITLAAIALFSSACYHATIVTGLPASTEVITKEWAHSFIIGLVPPSIVETAAKCKNGVAKVETQHSFLNGLVAIITWSIYTPIQIDVTCASSSRMGALQGGAEGTVIRVGDDTPEAGAAALNQAAMAAVSTGRATFVVF